MPIRNASRRSFVKLLAATPLLTQITARDLYARLFGLSRARADAMPDTAVIMHPGPMNRGVEIASDVADLPRAVITDQVTNGIAVRMSLLYLVLGGDRSRSSDEDGSAGDGGRAKGGAPSA